MKWRQAHAGSVALHARLDRDRLLLLSVVARMLGWALIFSGNGILSQALVGLGLVSSPVSLMFTETGVIIALAHVAGPVHRAFRIGSGRR